jgi:predicted transposase YbfD/YdcC
LEGVDLKGKVVTADAMHTKKESAREIVNRVEPSFFILAYTILPIEL